jgi:Na+-transporting NADH:ubiquinone oxidoreductase subunit NqrB
VAGHTPYVRDAADLKRFIATVHDYCAWFRDEMGGQFMGVSQLKEKLAAQR